MFGIVIGVALSARLAASNLRLTAGTSFAAKRVLQASIVLLGTAIPLSQVWRVGVTSLPLMIITMTVALGGAALLGRAFKVPPNARLLIGVGTGICGASAIAAVSAVVDVAEVEVAYAVGTIFLFNVIAVLSFPLIGHLLSLSQHSFGLWAGTSINDTSSVVAAAYTFGAAAGAYAVVVKLTRTLLIVPIVLFLDARRRRRDTAPSARRWWTFVPGFIVLFLVASALSPLVPSSWRHLVVQTATFLITVALAAIGLNTRFSAIRAAGIRPLLLGGLLWVGVATSALLVLRA